MSNKAIQRYTRTLFLSASSSSDLLESISLDMKLIQTVILKTPAFKDCLTNPLFGSKKIENLFTSFFKPSINPLTFNFLLLLLKKKRIDLLVDIPTSFQLLYEKSKKIVRVSVVSVKELTTEQIEKLKEKINTLVDANVIEIENKIDKSLIAGLQIRIGDTLIDANVKHKLNQLKRKLVA